MSPGIAKGALNGFARGFRAISGRGSVCRVAVIALLLLPLASCDVAPGQETGGQDLPGKERVTAAPGCTLVAVSPAVALKPESVVDGGTDGARALVRHEADCVPDLDQPATAYTPYRLHFEQVLTQTRIYPGGVPVWMGGEARYIDDSDQPSRQVDAGTVGMGANCAVLLDRLESRVMPCLLARDAATGQQFRQALDRFRAQQGFTMNVRGDNALNAKKGVRII